MKRKYFPCLRRIVTKDGAEPPLDSRTLGRFITRDHFRPALKKPGLCG
jgi:hypothetical protein